MRSAWETMNRRLACSQVPLPSQPTPPTRIQEELIEHCSFHLTILTIKPKENPQFLPVMASNKEHRVNICLLLLARVPTNLNKDQQSLPDTLYTARCDILPAKEEHTIE